MSHKNDQFESLSEFDTAEFDPDATFPHPDDLLSVLADPDRRRAMWFLLNQPQTTAEELADVLLGWEVSDGSVVGPSERSRTMLSLYHTHLPKLDASGLVDYDPATGNVRRASLAPPVDDLIGHVYRYDQGVATLER